MKRRILHYFFVACLVFFGLNLGSLISLGQGSATPSGKHPRRNLAFMISRNPIASVPITITDGAKRFGISPMVVIDPDPDDAGRKLYYVLPIFSILDAVVIFDNGDPQSFLNSNNKVRMPSVGVRWVKLEIKLKDLNETDLRDQIQSELKKWLPLKDRVLWVYTPARKWIVQLFVPNSRNGALDPVTGMYEIQLDDPVAKFTFDLLDKTDKARWEAIQNESPGQIKTRITGEFEGTFQTREYEIVGEQAKEQFRNVVNTIRSQSGSARNMLFIPVGGEAEQRYNLKEIYSQNVNITIRTFDGAPVDPATRNAFVNAILDRFAASTKAQEVKDDTVLNYLLSSGVQISATKSKIESIVDDAMRESDKSTRDLLEEASKNYLSSSSSQLNKGAFSISSLQDVSGGLSIFGVGAGEANVKQEKKEGSSFENQSAAQYSKLDEGAKKSVEERFKHDLEDLKRMVTGNISTVDGISYNQLSDIASGTFLKAKFTSEQVVSTEQEISQTINFQSLARDESKAKNPGNTAFTEYPIALKTLNDHLLTAKNGGGKGGDIKADRRLTDLGDWESFALKDLNGGDLVSGDLVVIRTSKGFFLRAADYLYSDSIDESLPASRFTILRVAGNGPIKDGDRVALKTNAGHYVQAYGGEPLTAGANARTIDRNSTFILVFR